MWASWGARVPRASRILTRPHGQLEPRSGPDGDPRPTADPREQREVPSQSCATQPCSPATRFLAPTTACSCGPFEYPWSPTTG